MLFRGRLRAHPLPNAITAIAKMTHTSRYGPGIAAAEVESASFAAAFFAGRSEADERGQPEARRLGEVAILK